MGGEVRRQAAEGAPPNNDREVFSEELSHAGIFLIYLIDRRNSPHSHPPWHVPLEVNNYALCLVHLRRLEEARSLLRRTIPVAQRVLGEGQTLTLRMRCIYAETLYKDVDGTVEDLRARVGEAVTTLEEIERTAQRVLGVGHPLTVTIEKDLRTSRAGLRTLGPPPPGPSVERTFARGWLDGPG